MPSRYCEAEGRWTSKGSPSQGPPRAGSKQLDDSVARTLVRALTPSRIRRKERTHRPSERATVPVTITRHSLPSAHFPDLLAKYEQSNLKGSSYDPDREAAGLWNGHDLCCLVGRAP